MERQRNNQNQFGQYQQAQQNYNYAMQQFQTQMQQSMQKMNQQMGQSFQNMQQNMQQAQQGMYQNQQHLYQQQQNQYTDMGSFTNQPNQPYNYNYPPSNPYQNQQQPYSQQDGNYNPTYSNASSDSMNSSNPRKQNSKINEQETKILFDNIFDQDKEKVLISMACQDELASSLRKGKNSSIKQQLKSLYKDQLNYIKKNGFSNTIKILLLLQEENGNEEIVLRRLVQETLTNQALKIRYDKQITHLQQAHKIKRCKKFILKYLKETKGDLSKAQQLIELEQHSRQQEEVIFKQQLQTIALEGWLNSATKRTIIKTLSKNKGNLEKSRNEIQLRCYHRIKQLTSSEVKKLNDFNCSQHFTDNLTDLVIDGNNLLFMNPDIRKNCINKQRNLAERKICQLARHLKEILDMKITIVIFDQMYESICDTKIQVINCKNTQFNSSDDFIVDHVQCLKDDQAKKTLIVTSDQELTYRIISTNPNISVMKGKTYFQQIEELLSKEIFSDIVTNNDL